MSSGVQNSADDSLDLYLQLQSSLQNAKLGLTCVLGAASLGLGIGALVVRRRGRFTFDALPQWTLIGFLFANFLFAVIVSVGYGATASGVVDVTTTRSENVLRLYYYVYYAAETAPFFFLYAGNCCLVYILYRLVHLFLTRCPTVRPSSPRLERFHLLYVGLIVVLTIVEWALLTTKIVRSGRNKLLYSEHYKVHAGFSTAACIVRLAAAVEIAAWTIYFAWKNLGKRSRWRVLAILLLIGSTFFFALSLMWFAWNIRWLLWPLSNATAEGAYSNAVDSARICEACFYLCIYVGLPSFYLRWGWLATKDKQPKLNEKEKGDDDYSCPAEADSRPRAELVGADAETGAEADSAPVFEAPVQPVCEAEATVIVEADSKEVGRKPT